jgi:WD40 repeat protein
MHTYTCTYIHTYIYVYVYVYIICSVFKHTHTPEYYVYMCVGVGVFIGKDHKVKLWDPKSGKCLDTIHRHKNPVRTCAWLPNGNSFVTGGRDQKLKLFDLRRTADALMTFNGHKNEITALAMHPHDETLFVSGDYTG